MSKRPSRLISLLTTVAIATTAPAGAQSSQSTASANAASAASMPKLLPPVPVNESPADRKARERAMKAADKAAAKARKDADRAQRPKSNTGAKIAGCVGGALVGAAVSLLFGGKSAGALIASAVVGCVGGWKLGAALKGDDDKKLSGYLAEDYVDRDDLNQTVWHAPESGADIQIQNVGESYKMAKQTISVDQAVDFDQTNIKIATRKMRTIGPVKLRSSMNLASDANVIGRFDANEIVQAYGDSTDGKWIYLGERQSDGGFLLIGYVPAASVTTSLQISPGGTILVAKPKPKMVAKAPVRAKGRVAAKAAPVPAQPAAAPTVAKTYSFSAPTRCKSMKLSALGNTDTKPVCGGAKSIA